MGYLETNISQIKTNGTHILNSLNTQILLTVFKFLTFIDS